MAEYILSFDLGIINTAYCIVRISDLRIIRWGLFNIKDSTNEGSCTKLVKHLDRLNLCSGRNVLIVIEQQPRCNVKTIVISGQLQMYFVLEKLTLLQEAEEAEEAEDSENEGTSVDKVGSIQKIVGHHAKHKIKYYQARPEDPPWPERITKLSSKGSYKTKQTLIEHCRRILGHHQESKKWIDFFEANPKRDDLADSFCQALSYIKMNKLGPFKIT